MLFTKSTVLKNCNRLSFIFLIELYYDFYENNSLGLWPLLIFLTNNINIQHHYCMSIYS